MNNVTAHKIDGQVKWFDPVKGFGFVVASGGGPDILLHANVLRNFGQSSVADGANIELLAQETQRGVQAVEILSIHVAESEDSVPLADFEELDAPDVKNLPLQPARVKWFDKGKGFGFANVFGREEDIFVHVEVLRRQGLAELQPGEALAIRVMEGRRGLMAAQVCSWENALDKED
ncbi:cold-shock protein [Cognatishimia activa]|uniref:cold-shock protein n=1 Tax=Cognatishimia activa TaxID=1715691 RepID=UPI002232A5EC|nr:cold shock domain-containing protein [Cognatishimia activa]UZD92308.1 cold shock domain-containing protein [Cognatishimia activa]